MKKFLFALIALFICVVTFGQEVEAVVTPSTFDLILAWLSVNWETGIGLAALLLSVLARFIPTEKANLAIDIIGWIIKIIPNRKKGGGVH